MSDCFAVTINKSFRLGRELFTQMVFDEDKEGLTAPEVFSYPCSPHMASALQKRPINFEKILKATQVLSERYDRVIVEGAGALWCP